MKAPNTTRRRVSDQFIIDKEIAALVPSLSPEELAQLERSLLTEGCREPLTVLMIGENKILGDGHNRYALCRRHRIKYELKHLELEDREAAIRWIAAHQLGRRNLTPEAESYLHGKLYNSMKRPGSRSDLTSGQSDQKSTTAQQLAEQFKTAEKTIRRDGHFAEQLDALVEAVGPDIKDQVLTRGARISRIDVSRLLQLDEPTRTRIVTAVRAGAKASALLRDLGRNSKDASSRERNKPGRAPQAGAQGQPKEEAPMPGRAANAFRAGGSLATPSGSTSASPADTETSAVPPDVNTALEHLEIAVDILRRQPSGGVSPEVIDSLDAQLWALMLKLKPRRQATPEPLEGPSADVLATAQVVFELQRAGVLPEKPTLIDVSRENPFGREALQAEIAKVQEVIAKRSHAPEDRHKLVNDIKGEDDSVRLSWKAYLTIQRYLSRHNPTMEQVYNEYLETRADSPDTAWICDRIDCFIDNGGIAIIDDSFSFLHYRQAHCADPTAYDEVLRAAAQEMVEELREINRITASVVPQQQRASMPELRSASSAVSERPASRPALPAMQPQHEGAPVRPVTAAPAGPAHHGLPAVALASAQQERAVDPSATTTVSSAAQREISCEHPTDEEIERDVAQITDDLRSGRLRHLFMAEHKIWQNNWPKHVKDEAIKLLRLMLNKPPASTDPASPHQQGTSVPVEPPVDAAPSATHIESVALTALGASEVSTHAIAEAMTLVSWEPPGVLARAMKLALWAQ